jgi:N-acetylmuramoyl-L-alanine amidase
MMNRKPVLSSAKAGVGRAGPPRPAILLLWLFIGAAPALVGQNAGRESPESPAGTPSGHAEKSLSLDEALSRLSFSPENAELRWDPFFGAGVFVSAGHYAAFSAGNSGETGPVLVDNRDLIETSVPYIERGELRFPEAFILDLRRNLDGAVENDNSRFRIAAIIVDPGHGGRDSGAVGNHVFDGKSRKILEKDITLAASKLLHARLAAAYPDKRVLLTRDGDTYPSLEDRVVIANSVPLKDNEAIVFISIHANASFNSRARGYEVWYLSPGYRRTVIDREKYADSADVIPILNAMLEEEYTTESILIAQSITKRIDETLGGLIPSRGIKAEEWFVVRNARMPSVLVELGFITNPEDARLMTDEACLRNMSDALYKGIADFIAVFERSGGFTAIQ